MKSRLKRVLGETILWRSLLALRWTFIPSIKRPIQRYVIIAADYWFDVRFGTDTARQVPADRLQGVGDNRIHAGKYQASVPGHFRRLMTAVSAPPDSVFVDFGCGKGRALMLAAGHGFRRVVGVEFAHDLCAVAARNLEVYPRARGLSTSVEIVQWVLDNIVESLRRAPRPAWLILYAAACHEVVDKCGVFVAIAQFPLSRGPFWTLPGPGRDSIVYTNRSRDGELLA